MTSHNTSSHTAAGRTISGIPYDAWYAAALTEEVGRVPVARVVLGRRVVLYRRRDGQVVALADRCAHAPVALSDGVVEGDDIVAPYTGFRYGPDGVCVAVPTQPNVPYGTAVHAFPVKDDGSFVWLWPGEARAAALRPTPSTAWLRDAAYATVGSSWETAAALGLMQDNFADITHLSRVDTAVAPPALADGAAPPPLQVAVTETTVSFSRDFEPAPVSPWQADLMGVEESARFAQREEGSFVAPGLWVDRWTTFLPGGGTASFVFAHALTPVSATSTRHVWRVSRNFALGAAGDGTVLTLLERYYRRVREILEAMQVMVDTDGPNPSEVRVAADAAGSQVRRIMARLSAEDI